MMAILFSPLGDSDWSGSESSNEGSVLHILRNYPAINTVVLYLSADMIKKNNNEPFVKLVNHIRPGIVCKFEERPDLIDVQRFDQYYEDFNSIISCLHEQHPESQIYVNTASGTPAMKSTLMILSELQINQITALQVDNPKYSQAENRVTKVQTKNFRSLISIQNIKVLVENYDYESALQLLKQLPEAAVATNDKVARLLTRAADNIQLRGDIVKLFAAILVMEIKLKKCEYRDFIVRATPVISKLFQMIISENYPPYNGCLESNKVMINAEKARNDKVLSNALVDMLAKEQTSFYIYNSDYLNIINLLPNLDQNIKDDCALVRNLEDKGQYHLRNDVAHGLTDITYTKVCKNAKPEEVILTLKRLYEPFRKEKEKQQPWDHFKKLNTKIIKALNFLTNP